MSVDTSDRANGRLDRDAAPPVVPSCSRRSACPLDEEASVFAVDTAVESGQRLVMANVTTPRAAPHVDRARATTPFPSSPPRSRRRSVDPPSSRGRSASTWSGSASGARVRCRRSWSWSPNVRPGLLVFGPDRTALRERRYRRPLACRARPGHLPRLGSHRRRRATDDLPHRPVRTAGRGRRSSSPTAARPLAGPARTASDAELAGYLFFRENVNGWQTEWWLHRDGCRRWFLAERHTADERGPADVLAERAGQVRARR